MPVFKTVTPAGLEKRLSKVEGKYGKNNSLATITKFTACSWGSTGALQKASSLLDGYATIAGITQDDILPGAQGVVRYSGVVIGALVGMGAQPNQEVFLSTIPGQMTLTPPPPESGIIRIGFAQPAEGVTDGSATDLLVEFEIIVRATT